MSDKIKACCENCNFRYGRQATPIDDHNIEDCAVVKEFVKLAYNPTECVCFNYDGNGQTPERRIAELEAENAKLEEQLDSLSHIDNDATNLEEAKQYAQDWLVSFVANACGIEVRNER